MVTRNESMLNKLDGCTAALRRIDEARKAISKQKQAENMNESNKRFEVYRKLDAAQTAVIEYQRAVINNSPATVNELQRLDTGGEDNSHDAPVI